MTQPQSVNHHQHPTPNLPANLDIKISQIHGFTGSHLAYSRNIPSLSKVYRVVAPDLRGHGESGTPDLKVLKSATVVRLAVDLGELIVRLAKGEGKTVGAWRGRVMGGSLGCAVIW